MPLSATETSSDMLRWASMIRSKLPDMFEAGFQSLTACNIGLKSTSALPEVLISSRDCRMGEWSNSCLTFCTSSMIAAHSTECATLISVKALRNADSSVSPVALSVLISASISAKVDLTNAACERSCARTSCTKPEQAAAISSRTICAI